ncbi:hypothetical protein, partial [uncultured Thiodictyon sp.]|uniref:hypothetical protein n=1 Tax=uncultured Thiodictyon sp. TaxID=1846217 RepID=UPI0025E4A7AB
KKFAFRDSRYRMTLRAEFFDAFNRHHYNSPNTGNIHGDHFGNVTGVSGNRQGQLGARKLGASGNSSQKRRSGNNESAGDRKTVLPPSVGVERPPDLDRQHSRRSTRATGDETPQPSWPGGGSKRIQTAGKASGRPTHLIS